MDTPEQPPLSTWREWFIGLACALASALLLTAAAPHPGVPEAAYAFALPLLFWSMTQPRWRVFLVTTQLAGWVYWLVTIFWLRYVTTAGLIGLSFVLAFFFTAWFAAARWTLANPTQKSATGRILVCLQLAGLWVVLEWVRTWLLTGFPWMPLAATQWQRPAILQPAAWAGAWAISFILILFNLGLAAYGRNLFTSFRREGKARRWWQRLVPEFYLGLVALLGAVALYTSNYPQKENQQPLFRAGFVQPWIDPVEKWENPTAAWRKLTLHTLGVSATNPDLILWPEAATPWWVINQQGDATQRAIEDIATEYQTPILMGNLAEITDEIAHNGIFFVSPETGLMDTFYAKTHLVPYGEYVPLRGVLPFIEDIGPLAHMGDFTPGAAPVVLEIPVAGRTFQVGPLVCFEDIFPGIARTLARDGAQFFFVATNNAWHGQEGSAYQHAAHSALRAVENRRPVLRCANHGWSGWFDEYGHTRAVIRGEDGSIYTSSSATYPIFQDKSFAGKTSFYTRNGDWFVALCGVLTLGLFLRNYLNRTCSKF